MKSKQRTNRKSEIISRHWSIGLVSLIYLITLSILPLEGFWTVDQSNKFIQLNAIIQNDYKDTALNWSGQNIDPSFVANPLPRPFSFVVENRLYSVFSPVFAFFSAPAFQLFGTFGLYLLPFVFSVLSLFAIRRITELLAPHGGATHLTVLICGLCLPLWFYAVVFWEHIVSVGLCLWSVVFLLHYRKKGTIRNIVFASLTAALCAYFRDEFYLFCFIVILSIFKFAPNGKIKDTSIAIGATLAGVAPLWIFQYISYDNFLGAHFGLHLPRTVSAVEHLVSRWSVFYTMILGLHPQPWISIGLSIPFIALILINWIRPSGYRVTWAVAAVYCIATSIFYLIALAGAQNKIVHLVESSNSFWGVAPVIVFAGLRSKNAKGESSKHIFGIAIAFAVLYVLVAPKDGSTGLHWGNRYFLPVYVLFGILATQNFFQVFLQQSGPKKMITVLFTIACISSLVLQIHSVHLLHKRKSISAELNRLFEHRTEQAIVCTDWWIPQELYKTFNRKPVFFLNPAKKSRDAEAQNLFENLKKSNIKDVLIISSGPDAPPGSPAEIKEDEHFGFYTINYYSISLSDIK